MASRQQMTGMRGVYLVAAELSRLGFIASPTSRSARGADILVTDQSCQKTYSVQVKTNARTFGVWLLSKNAKEQISKSHIYVLVNIKGKEGRETVEYYIVPSKVVGAKMGSGWSGAFQWHAINLKVIQSYKDKWSLFGKPNG